VPAALDDVPGRQRNLRAGECSADWGDDEADVAGVLQALGIAASPAMPIDANDDVEEKAGECGSSDDGVPGSAASCSGLG
jgi:hypothetical protein